ncbi:hypothetical protein DVA86_09300 [Streptomyces armeniacus]|uniref:Uncharacterized protein n=1 Tax=Streptomyces armeniacus TaxID=83291 RepID=A0A345XME9_9ACTN|nr:hypothetical protein DVA86_09300 [Streptomyces armeniacus]
MDLAMVQAQRLTTGAVSRAGRFGSYAPSTAIRVTGPVVDSLVGLQAEWFGHGVVHDNAVVGCRLVALPRVLTNSRHTEAAWRFSEQVYGRLRPR